MVALALEKLTICLLLLPRDFDYLAPTYQLCLSKFTRLSHSLPCPTLKLSYPSLLFQGLARDLYKMFLVQVVFSLFGVIFFDVAISLLLVLSVVISLTLFCNSLCLEFFYFFSVSN